MLAPSFDHLFLFAFVASRVQGWVIGQHQPHRPGVAVLRLIDRAQGRTEGPRRTAHGIHRRALRQHAGPNHARMQQAHLRGIVLGTEDRGIDAQGLAGSQLHRLDQPIQNPVAV